MRKRNKDKKTEEKTRKLVGVVKDLDLEITHEEKTRPLSDGLPPFQEWYQPGLIDGIVNFKGKWEHCCGAFEKNNSVTHNNLLWVLNRKIKKVESSEPSLDNLDWSLHEEIEHQGSIDIQRTNHEDVIKGFIDFISTGNPITASSRHDKSVWYKKAAECLKDK